MVDTYYNTEKINDDVIGNTKEYQKWKANVMEGMALEENSGTLDYSTKYGVYILFYNQMLEDGIDRGVMSNILDYNIKYEGAC